MKREQVALVFLLSLCLHSTLVASRQNPKIFSGNDSFSDRELLAYLSERSLPGESPSSAEAIEGRLSRSSFDALKRTERLLRQFYQDRGFPLAQVRLTSKPPDISFQISEGPNAKLGWVEFTGNSAVDDETLERLLGLKRILNFNTLEEGLDRVRAHYRDLGYPRVQVGEPEIDVVEMDEPDNFPLPFRQATRARIRLRIAIQEGALFRYGKIDVEIASEQAQFSDDLPRPGEIYRQSDLTRLRDRIYATYLEQGRVVKEFQVFQNLRDDESEADLRVVCALFPPLIVKRIEFEGNRRYPDQFYRRELLFGEEEVLDPRKIEKSLPELLETGALESLNGDDVELVVRETELEADLILHLHEKDRHRILFSLGPDGLGGWETGLLYSALNALGLGEKLGLDLRVGSTTSELAATWASRYFLGTQIPASLALRVFRRNTRFELPGAEDRLRTLFSSNASGITAGGRYRIRPGETIQLEATAERVTNPVRSDHFSLGPSWQKSSKGEETRRTFEASTRFSRFTGSSDSWNFRADLALSGGVRPDDLRTRGFAYRAHAAHARFFGDPEPLFERLLKEDRELRGFSTLTGPWATVEGELVPVGGDSLFALGGEYQVPIARNLSLAPFVDGGVNLATTQPGGADLAQETGHVWRMSLGAEVRIRPFRNLPVTRLIFSWNPLRLDKFVATSRGLARLRDPAWSFQIGLF